MECEVCREALSVRLDDEQESTASADVDAHLATCADCRTWLISATALTRTLRVRPTVEIPDFVDAVSAATPDSALVGRRRLPALVRGHAARSTLALIGCVQTILGAAQMLGSGLAHGGHTEQGMAHDTSPGMDMTGHLFNESAAWNVAIGLALLWAVARPRAIAGLIPLLSVFVAGLTVFVVSDLANAAVTPSRAISHVVVVAALVVLLWLHRHPDQHDSPTRAALDDRHAEWPTDAADTRPNRPAAQRRRGHLRPASRRAA